MPLPRHDQASDAAMRALTVFVVEDESLVALNLEDMLMDLGHTVVGPAMRIDRAKRMIEGDFTADVAILDVNVAGEPVYPVAQMLVDRGVPVVFATGYDRDSLPERWQGDSVLQKPYTMADISSSIATALRIASRA